MILLFDIDGTLITCGGAGRRALDRAFHDVLGRDDALRDVRLAGSTDLQIIEDALAALRSVSPGLSAPAETLLDRYLDCLEEELERAGARYRVLEGALELLEVLSNDPRFVLGLATGNVERGARLKLRPRGLDRFFDFGGFGSDARERPELVKRGVERGLQRARARNLPFGTEDVIVLGDTGKDVEAARAAGVRSVGVLSGSQHHEELHASGPTMVVESLRSEALWHWLGLSPFHPHRSKT